MEFLEALVDPVAEGLGPMDVPEGDGEDDFGRAAASKDSGGQREAVVDHAQAVGWSLS